MTPRRLYNFRIDADLEEGLARVKERDGVAESEQIRRALREWLTEKGVMKAQGKRAATRKPR